MSEIDKEKDIDQLIYRELPPDRYCYIHNYIVDLQNKLQQKENIIKEVREYIESYGITKEQLKKMSFGSAAPISIGEMLNILEILDKENK